MEKNDNKKLISLKEAAKLSGYSSDYIGQLIRGGKISGKQVYCNIAWMTTLEAVLAYKNKKEDSKLSLKDKVLENKRKIDMELNIIKLFFTTFRSALPILVIVLISFCLLVFSIFYMAYTPDNEPSGNKLPPTEESLQF